MSDPLCFDRYRKLPDATPLRLCRFCQKPITEKRRSSWCSKECSTEGAIRMDGGYARMKVEERDHGVCASCGMDTEYVKSLLDPLMAEASARWREPDIAAALRTIVYRELRDLGFSPAIAGRARQHSNCLFVHLWECDHIVPVVEGGGGCGLENLRTMCRRSACHPAATKALAGRRAKTVRLRKKQRRHEARMRAKQMRLA